MSESSEELEAVGTGFDAEPHRLMRWFDGSHLATTPLRQCVESFQELAIELDHNLPPSAEKTVVFRKLLEAKDAAVRTLIEGGALT